MRSADFHATRDDVFTDEGLAPSFEEGVAHCVDPWHERGWSRLRRLSPGLAGALIINGLAVVVFVILWRGMARDLTTPEGIPVEIVDRMPGEADKAPAAEKPAAPAVETVPKPAAPSPSPPAPAAPDAQADALKDALAMPAMPAGSAAPEPAGAAGSSQPKDDTDEKPPVAALAAPPPEPKAAAAQPAPDEKPNAAEETDKTATQAPPPAPPAPDVLTVPQAEASVPAPSREPEPTAPPKTSEPDRDPSKEATARLSAALPTSSFAMPSTFRAMLSSQGTSSSQEYKGAVFGSLSRATQAVSEEARRRHLKGQVVVNIVLDAGGGLAKAAIVQSSGSAEVDALALDMVRRAAPFPPPPAGTPRSFTPVITIGDD